MTKTLTDPLLIIILFLPLVSNAKAKDYYLKSDLGVSMPHNKVGYENGYIAGKRIDAGPQYSLGAGYHAAPNLRFDLTLSHMGDLKYEGKVVTTLGQTLIQKEKTKVDTLMLNTYYHLFADKKPSVPFSPFIGAGFGVAKIKHDDAYVTSARNSAGKAIMARKPATNLAFNFIAGISMPVTDNFIIEWSYKYAYLGKVKSNTTKLYINDVGREVPLNSKKYNLSTHNPAIGIRYSF